MSQDVKQQAFRQTQDMLARHHRNGEAFAQLMKDTYESRFNDDFWRLWQQYIDPVISRQPKDDSKKILIDFGAGPGKFVQTIATRYPDINAIGVEVAHYMLDAIDKLPDNANIIMADLHDPKLDMKAGSVDVAVASVVLHEMHQPVKMLHEVERLLRSGGLFYILDWVRVPLQQYLANSDVDAFSIHTSADALEELFVHFIEHNRFSVEDLVFMLHNCGFKIEFQQLINDNQMVRLIAKKN